MSRCPQVHGAQDGQSYIVIKGFEPNEEICQGSLIQLLNHGSYFATRTAYANLMGRALIPLHRQLDKLVPDGTAVIMRAKPSQLEG